MSYVELHTLAGPVLILVLVVVVWRKVLVLLSVVLAAAIAIGLYQIVGFIRS